MEATERPWKWEEYCLLDANDNQIANSCDSPLDNDEENLELIVRAVNSHDRLLAALKSLLLRIDNHFNSIDGMRDWDWKEQEEARAAIGAAERPLADARNKAAWHYVQ